MSHINTPPFNPLSIKYLPDTYFPYAKRPMNHRPYTSSPDEQTPAIKRPRRGPSPIEHKNLSAIKKLERESTRTEPGACETHRTILNMPQNILKYLQSQGVTMNRTNEALEVLSGQVTDLTQKLQSALTQQPPKRNISPLLTSYHTIILETLKKFKNFKDAEQTQSKTSPATKYIAIRTALDCISKLHHLIILHCNFDCYPANNQISPLLDTSIPVTPTSVSISRDSTRVTWKDVYTALTSMEYNLRTFMERVGANNTYKRSNEPKPIHTSTPNRIPHLTQEKKRKIEETDHPGIDQPNDITSRKKLTSKRVCFLFDNETRMEVD